MELRDAAPAPDDLLPLQQTPQFARALRLMDRPAHAIAICHRGEVLAHTVLIERRWPRFCFCSRGPIWRPAVSDGDKEHALRHLRGQGLALANGDHTATAHLWRRAGYHRILTGQTVAELDLTAPEGWRHHAHRKWRYRLARATRGVAHLDLSSRPFDPLRDADLLGQCAQMARLRGYRQLPLAMTTAFAHASPGGARSFLAHEKGALIAGIVVLRHGATATYHLGWSGAAGRQANAHRLLLAQAADWLVSQGVRRFDLGSIDTEAAPDLARFKLGMGAEAKRLCGTWLRGPFVPDMRPVAFAEPKRPIPAEISIHTG